MRVLKVPEGGPKKKLLDAAELLVSEKGFDLVSVRDVTGAVKANVAAVNYHFGSREGMMDLLMLRSIAPLYEERLDALEKAERKHAGKMVQVEEIVSSYVSPLAVPANRLGMENALFLRTGRPHPRPREETLSPALLAPQQGSRAFLGCAFTRPSRFPS